MFNPLKKISSIEKRMLIGGVASSIAYYGNLYAEYDIAGYPAQLKDRLDKHLPTYGDIIGSLAPLGVFFLAKKIVKKPATKEKLADMTLGSALFGLPNLMKVTGVQTAGQAGLDTRPARLPSPTVVATSRYIANSTPNNRPVAAAYSLSKYRITG